MLSKSKGQILRTAAVMHTLFHWETPACIPDVISEMSAVKSVEHYIQHTCYLSGRGEITEEIEDIQTQGLCCANNSYNVA